MAKLHEVSPHVQWALDQVRSTYPNDIFTICWEAYDDTFVITTNNRLLFNSREFSRFSGELAEAVFAQSPFEIYFMYDESLDHEDSEEDNYEIDVREMCLRYTREFPEYAHVLKPEDFKLFAKSDNAEERSGVVAELA